MEDSLDFMGLHDVIERVGFLDIGDYDIGELAVKVLEEVD